MGIILIPRKDPWPCFRSAGKEFVNHGVAVSEGRGMSLRG